MPRLVVCLVVAAAAGRSPASGPVVVGPPGCPPCPPAPVEPIPADPTLPPAGPAAPGQTPAPGQPPAAPTGDTPPGATPPAPPAADPGAQAAERGGQPVAGFRQAMFGDQLGLSATVVLTTPPSRPTPPAADPPAADPGPPGLRPLTPGRRLSPFDLNGDGRPDAVRAPLVTRYNGIRVADNESPVPQDRVAFAYNYFYSVNQALNPPTFPRTTAQRQTVAVEKTFLAGDASVGLRLPFVQVFGDPLVDQQKVGDLSVLLKAALWYDRAAGDLISAGLIVTAPTGGTAFAAIDGVPVEVDSTLFQPWVGFLTERDRWFAQGFGSVVLPTDWSDTILLFNSVGGGYRLYRAPRARWLTAVTPVAELHVATPLNNRTLDEILYFQDQVNVTAGSYFEFGKLVVGTAFSVPMAGPRPWQYEVIVNVNYRF